MFISGPNIQRGRDLRPATTPSGQAPNRSARMLREQNSRVGRGALCRAVSDFGDEDVDVEPLARAMSSKARARSPLSSDAPGNEGTVGGFITRGCRRCSGTAGSTTGVPAARCGHVKGQVAAWSQSPNVPRGRGSGGTGRLIVGRRRLLHGRRGLPGVQHPTVRIPATESSPAKAS